MASTSTSATRATPRFDFYQTDTVITLSIFIKSISPNSLSVNITPSTLSVSATCSTTGSEYILNIDPLFSPVDPSSCSYKVFSTKIEIILHKAQPGLGWVQLQGGAQNQAVTSAITQSQTEAKKPTRSKWDTFDPDADDNTTTTASGGGGGGGDGSEADINKFFQKLYADADQDTKRAMMKSYQESGGTALSTDWSKVGKEQIKIHPPEGIEAKKWEQ